MANDRKDWIFVSDAHFTGKKPEEMEPFLKFLDKEEERMGHLVILGDLFEFFFGFKWFLSAREPTPFEEYLPVFNRLQELYHHGIQIKYFEGNHDFFLYSFFSKQLGMKIEVFPESAEEDLAGKRTYLAHGDLSNPNQWNYRIFRRILKNQLTYHFIHLSGPNLSRRIAKRLSEMSYQRYHIDVESNPPPAFRRFAHQKFLEGFEIVILGHSHYPEEIEEWIGGRRCLYFNIGDWKTRQSFLRFSPPEHFQLEQFSG